MAGTARSNTGGKAVPKTLTERMAAWQRRKNAIGFNWRDVDAVALKAALHAIIAADCAIMFARARGGEGVMVKIYDEGEPGSQFAADSVEMDELLLGMVAVFGGSSEDLLAAMQSPTVPVSLAAD